MLLQNQLIAILEKGQSRAMVDETIQWVGDDPIKFKLLVKLLESTSKRPIPERAAWGLSYIAELHPEQLKPHWPVFVKLLVNKHTTTPVKRGLLRFMQFCILPLKYQGLIVDRCFELVNDPNEEIAIRVFSMTILGNLVATYPEIANELKLSIELMLPHASPAVKNRAKQMMKKLKSQ